jgi:hypothetical protein
VTVASITPRLRAREEAKRNPEGYERACWLNEHIEDRLKAGGFEPLPPREGICRARCET